MAKIKLGIVGIGNMGSTHTRNIFEGKCPELELVAVCDKKEGKFDYFKENYPEQAKDITVFTNIVDMLESGLVEACIIAVPHYDHPGCAIECLKRNIHVMVEKPAGVYVKQVEEMNEAAKNSDAVFGMMFNQRTNHVYRKMKELVSSGEFGQIRRVNWLITNWYRSQAYYDSGDWRATWSGEGGGVLLNQCPHQLDLMQWICGMPKSVRAEIGYGKWHDIEVDDDVTAYLEYENGATGMFITSTGDAYGSNRFEIQMDKAQLVVENDELKVTVFDKTEQEFSKTNTEPFGVPKYTNLEIVTDGENPQHIGVLNAWAGAILRGEPLVANGKEGINGVKLSNAMLLSSWLGQKVTLPLDNELYYEELMKRVATSRRKTNVKEVVADTSSTFGGVK